MHRRRAKHRARVTKGSIPGKGPHDVVLARRREVGRGRTPQRVPPENSNASVGQARHVHRSKNADTQNRYLQAQKNYATLGIWRSSRHTSSFILLQQGLERLERGVQDAADSHKNKC